MKILFGCGALAVLANVGLLIFCLFFIRIPSPGLTVTNHNSQPIERVVLSDSKGIVCSLTHVPPGATQRCSGEFRGDGPVVFELQAAKLKRSGSIGYAKPGAKEVFDVTLKRDGSVSWGATVWSYQFSRNAQHPKGR